ncbi:MAG: creatininase family protein [Gemmatimonadota bacterium]|nr:creatininase family protein [Gemmatimonadota bacterium]
MTTAAGGPSAPPVVGLLPVGAVEAHGPHLAVLADVIIATAAARASVAGLESLGFRGLVLPPVSYTPAGFAAGFPGTISVRPSTVRALLNDIAESLEAQGARAMVIVNAHLDPGHLEALHGAAKGRDAPRGSREHPAMPILFPDISRKPWALRLTDEFRSGACHGGRYETSVVLAAAPDQVRERVMVQLPENPASLSDAIRSGLATFEEAGVDRAYCGAPAMATAAEGRGTIRILGEIVVDAVRDGLGTEVGES